LKHIRQSLGLAGKATLKSKRRLLLKMWIELLAERYRQTIPKEYLRLLKVLRESGALTNKNLERILAANRGIERKYTQIDKSHLIYELNTLVINIIQNNIV